MVMVLEQWAKQIFAQLCKWIANGVKEVTIGHIATICQQH
jgi:hypothetical protein